MEIEKYKDKGLTGLANLGNTCYLNSYYKFYHIAMILTNI